MKKKLFAFLCVSLACLLLVSCGIVYKKPISNFQILNADKSPKALLDLTEEAMDTVINLLMDGEWEETDSITHGYDVEFETGEEKTRIRYHSSCGKFFDVTNGRTLTLTEKDREKMNSMFSLTRDVEFPENKASLKIIQYFWTEDGFSAKSIDGELAQYIADELAKLEKTGEKIDAISDEWMDITEKIGIVTTIDVDGGTKWIRLGENYYRIDRSIDAIYLVDGYLGAGEKLNASEELLDKIGDAWYYHPYNYFSGSYTNGELKISQKYEGETSADISVLEINLNEDGETGTVKLELFALVDGNHRVSVESLASEDNRGTIESNGAMLNTGESTVLEFSFRTFKYRFQLNITVDNTKIMIIIDP